MLKSRPVFSPPQHPNTPTSEPAVSTTTNLNHDPPEPPSNHNQPAQDFFETCAILITVVILGKYLECSAKGRTSAAIKVGCC